MNINGHEIGKAPFIIAEVGLNHCGDLYHAFQMIKAANWAGCNAVKFQTFKAVDVCDDEQEYTYQSQGKTITEKRINLFRRTQLRDSDWKLLSDSCRKEGIIFLSTPETPADLDILLEVGIPAIKIGSDNLTNIPMLKYCARDDVGLPIILSCGMSDSLEVGRALYAVGMGGAEAAVLVCTSQYPCGPESANLSRIRTLQRGYGGIPIGLSDHTIGYAAAVAAVGLGASIFECHFTLNHDLPGPDHWWSKTPEELREWVSAINTAHVMMGDGVVKPNDMELEAKAKFQRRVA